MRTTWVLALLLGACVGGDKDGNVSVDGPNQAPGAPRIRVGPDDPDTTADLEAYVIDEAIDPDGDPVTYSYRWFRDGELVEDLVEPVVPASETERGEEWQAVVSASDGELSGPSDEDDVEIVNAPPSIEIELGPEDPDTEASLVAEITVDDADDDEVTWSYVWSRNGADQDIEDLEVRRGQTTKNDVWTVRVVAVDSEEAEATAQESLTILNAAPTVTAASFTPDPLRAGQVARGAVEAGDPDGDALTTTWRWIVDGVTAAEGPEDSFEVDYTRGALIGLEVFVDDGDDLSETFTVPAIAVANTPPTGLEATISPAEPNEDKDVECAASGEADADGDAVSWTWIWEIDGQVVPGATGPTLSADETEQGQQVRCTAIPTDGLDDGEPLISAEIIIKNRAPSATSVVIGDPAVDGTLSATVVGATDPDEDPVSFRYAWSVNGRVVASTETLSASFFDRNDEVRVTVTPTDGDLDGASVQSAVYEIPDNPPYIASVTFNPAVVYGDTNVDALVVAEDPDGDTVTVTRAWTVNGAAQTGSGTSLQASKFAKGDQIRVSVTATANGRTSAASVATVTVSNRPPSAPVATLGAGIPEAGSPIVCALATPSTDTDGDTITYTVAWKRDDVAWTGAVQSSGALSGDRIPGAQIADDDRWSCTITASDGTDTRASAEVSTTIGDPQVVEDCLRDALPDALAVAIDDALGGHQWSWSRQTAGTNLIGQLILTDLDLDLQDPSGSWFSDGVARVSWPANWNSAGTPHEIRWTGILASDGNCKAYSDDAPITVDVDADVSYDPAGGVVLNAEIGTSLYDNQFTMTLTGPKCDLTWMSVAEGASGDTHVNMVYRSGFGLFSDTIADNLATIEAAVLASISDTCL
jgi:hypothetical protein